MFQVSPVIAIIAVFLVSYYGVKVVLGPPPQAPHCNMGMQSFDLRGRPLYWQVQEGPCGISDVNYNNVRANVENLLLQSTGPWPEAQCTYAQMDQLSFVFKFGTDYYDVEELDCLEPLRKMREEKEANYDIKQWFKDNVMQKNSNFNANQLINLL